MTNFEKYKDDLMKIERCFAFNKNTKKIVRCDNRLLNCKDCLFDEWNCDESDKIKWLYEEYKESILSDNELELIKSINKVLGKEYKYIYRNGKYIFIFSDKPNIDKYGIKLDGSDYIEITGRIDLFSNIKYEDGLYDIENKGFIKE